MTSKELLHALKSNIDFFVDRAPQFDDITMLMFDYFGGAAMKEERVFSADINALSEVQGFLRSCWNSWPAQ